MADAELRGRSVKSLSRAESDFRIDIDLDEAERAAARVREWLMSLRQRHDLARFEYTRHVIIVPAGKTYSHPILTLGTRFAETEDHLLATYLHEQMHWYLWRLGGPDYDPVTPFFDELVRRYPKAPTRLPEGARNYEQTYIHLVVCWLELKAVSELIGWERAAALAETNYGYRWIYRTVIRDFDALEKLFVQHSILPMQPADAFLNMDGTPRKLNGRALPIIAASTAKAPRASKIDTKKAPATRKIKTGGGTKKKTSKAQTTPSRRGRRKAPGRGGTSRG
ncbi:MAG: hypothetical protein ABL898_05415 [Hyphomicrobiaceae bacterium]|nr:hypothetical protein [Hyphomicrobiaceae bacterium]